MTDMSVQMILKLVDQFSGPAKQAETAADKFKREMQALNDIKSGGASKAWGVDKATFDKATAALVQRREQLGAAQRAEQEAARVAQQAAQQSAHAIEAAKRAEGAAATSAASQIVAANERIVASEQRTVAAIEKTTAQQAAAQASLQRQRSAAYVQAEREREREERARERAEQKARNAPGGASIVGGAVAMGAAYKAQHFAREGLHAYREWSDVNAISRPVGDLTTAQQAALKAQQFQLGMDTRFSPLKIAEAQKLLLERNIHFEHVRPYVEQAVNFASAMNVDLPAATKTLEAHLFATQKTKEIHSDADAKRIMQRSADINTRLNKMGMSNEDISGAWEYGGVPGHQAGLSDETMGAMFAMMKKNQIAGTAAGTAMRAIAAKLVSPTQPGIQAMAALGINYADFVKPGSHPSVEGFDAAFNRKYFKHLDASQMAQLREKLANPETLADRDKFIHELGGILSSGFKTKKGEIDKNKAQAIEKMVSGIFDKAIEGVDAEGLLRAIMKSNPSLAALNGLFGFQQGGRAGAVLQNPEEFEQYRKKLEETPIGFALEIATERLKSFDGAVRQLEGSIETLQIKIASAFDNSGKGGGEMTQFVQGLATATNWLVKLPEGTQRFLAEVAAAGTVFAALKGMGALTSGFGLTASAKALDGSAFALTAAAEKLSLGGGAKPVPVGPGAPSAPGAAPSAAPGPGGWRTFLTGFSLWSALFNAPSTPEEWNTKQEENDRFRGSVEEWIRAHTPKWLNPDKAILERTPAEMPVGSPGRAWAENNRASAPPAPDAFGSTARPPVGWEERASAAPSAPLAALPAPSSIQTPAGWANRAGGAQSISPQVDNSKLDDTNQKALSAIQTLQMLNGQEVKPNVETGPLDLAQTKGNEVHAVLQQINGTFSPKIDISSASSAVDALISKVGQLKAAMAGIGGGARSFSPSAGALHDGPEHR